MRSGMPGDGRPAVSRCGCRGRGLALAAGAASIAAPRARAAEPRSFSRVVDLTHAMGPDFPTYDGGANLGWRPS